MTTKSKSKLARLLVAAVMAVIVMFLYIMIVDLPAAAGTTELKPPFLSSKPQRLPPWKWSWDHVSTWCLAGGIGRPLLPAEVDLLSKFDMTGLWGINVSCDNGMASFAGHTHGVCPPGGHWLPTQFDETVRAAQIVKNKKPDAIVTSYIRFDVSQLWYTWGQEFNNYPSGPETHRDWWLVSNVTHEPIYCQDPLYRCNPEGVAAHPYNYTIPQVRDYFVNAVIPPFIGAPDLDGVFFDTFDYYFLIYQQQAHWSSDFVSALQSGTLINLERTLQAFSSANKYPVISSSSSIGFGDSYSAHLELLLKHGGFRYYEFFCGKTAGWFPCLTQVLSMQYEASLGLPIQIHAPLVDPDEAITFYLAVFFLSCGEYSYFTASVNNNWTPTGFHWYKEFEKPLGPPLGPAKREAGFLRFADENAIFGEVARAGTSTENCVFLGNVSSIAICENLCDRITLCHSYVWVSRYANTATFHDMCYGRMDTRFDIRSEKGVYSGIRNPSFQRNFLHATVFADIYSWNATITWAT